MLLDMHHCPPARLLRRAPLLVAGYHARRRFFDAAAACFDTPLFSPCLLLAAAAADVIAAATPCCRRRLLMPLFRYAFLRCFIFFAAAATSLTPCYAIAARFSPAVTLILRYAGFRLIFDAALHADAAC